MNTVIEMPLSVYTDTTHRNTEMSERYAHVQTSKIIESLQKQGFEVTEAKAQHSRKKEKLPFARHLVRLQHPMLGKLSDRTREVVILNSHDGSSSIQIASGYNIFACLNKLISGNTSMNIKVQHRGSNLLDNIIEGVFEVVDNFDATDRIASLMEQTKLTDDDRRQFAMEAVDIRWPKEPPEVNFDSLLYPLHGESKDTLWGCFNIVQEKLIKGGFLASKESEPDRYTRVRALSGITSQVRVNQRLWELAETFTN